MHARLSACVVTLKTATTKIFLSGSCWQAAVLLCGAHDNTAVGYFLAAGLGDALGVLMGSLIFGLVHSRSIRDAVTPGLVLAPASFLSGAFWQPLVNTLFRAGATFEIGSLLTGCGCGVAFFIGLGLTGSLVRTTTSTAVLKDATLSIAVAGAAAFFVGTDVAWHGNWLQGLVGERTGDSPIVDCLRAGLSTLVGFCALGGLLIVFVPTRLLWTTADQPQAQEHAPEPLLDAAADQTTAVKALPNQSDVLVAVVPGTQNPEHDVWRSTRRADLLEATTRHDGQRTTGVYEGTCR